MITPLNVFKYHDSEVKTISVGSEVWFLAKDVATILGYTNLSQAVRQHIDDSDILDDVGMKKKLRELTKNSNEFSQSSFDISSREVYTNEAGVYSLVFGSTLPEAKVFKRWVTHEVLPQIRKTGKYEVNPTPAIAPEMSAKDVINFSMDLLTLAGVKEPIRASFGLTAIAKLYPGYSDVVAEAKKLVSAQTTVEELPLSPTELGAAIANSLGLADTPSAIKVNKVLEELGFQTSDYEENSKGQKKKVWKATPKGEAFSQVQIDTAKSGKTVFKTCWFPSVLPEIKGSFA